MNSDWLRDKQWVLINCIISWTFSCIWPQCTVQLWYMGIWNSIFNSRYHLFMYVYCWHRFYSRSPQLLKKIALPDRELMLLRNYRCTKQTNNKSKQKTLTFVSSNLVLYRWHYRFVDSSLLHWNYARTRRVVFEEASREMRWGLGGFKEHQEGWGDTQEGSSIFGKLTCSYLRFESSLGLLSAKFALQDLLWGLGHVRHQNPLPNPFTCSGCMHKS